METITQSRTVKLLSVCFTFMWYTSLVGAIYLIVNFWYVPLKTGGEKLPNLVRTIELINPVQEYASTDKLGNTSELALKPKLVEASAEIRLANWSDMLQVEVVLYIVLVLISMALGLSLIYQFHKIFKSLRVGQVFHSTIIKRIRYIGFIMLLGPIIGSLSKIAYNQFMVNQIDVVGYKIDTGITLGVTTNFIMGFVVLTLAEVFKVGLQLQQEKELTI